MYRTRWITLLLLNLFGALLMLGCASPGGDESATAARQQLAPTGKVRVALSVGPSANQFRATIDRPTKRPRGVAVDLANALGEKLGVPVELTAYDNYVDLLEAGRQGTWDVTFLPSSEERAKILDFGAPYYYLETTYIVPAGSEIRNQSDVDRPGVRVGAVEKSLSARKLQQTLKNATLIQVGKLAVVQEHIATGKLDVAVAGRETLMGLAARLPGARILDDRLDAVPVSVAVPKNRPAALAYVTDFIETSKANGLVRRAFDNAGFTDAMVAPLASRR